MTCNNVLQTTYKIFSEEQKPNIQITKLLNYTRYLLTFPLWTQFSKWHKNPRKLSRGRQNCLSVRATSPVNCHFAEAMTRPNCACQLAKRTAHWQLTPWFSRLKLIFWECQFCFVWEMKCWAPVFKRTKRSWILKWNLWIKMKPLNSS